MNNIKALLKKLKLKDYEGQFDNGFFVINLKDSDEYAKVYSTLSETAVNTEFPNFGTSKSIDEKSNSKSVIKITNYFEVDDETTTYNIFLIANFEDDLYYLKIGEK